MTEEQAKAIFLLAGIKAAKCHKIENQYWPPAYVESINNSPWWLVETTEGLVQIGWRKRVISIDWTSCVYRGEVTEDEVTKDKSSVHAYGYAKAVEYLTNWRRAVIGGAQ